MTYKFQKGHPRKQTLAAFAGGLVLAIIVITWISAAADNARPPVQPTIKEVSQ